MLGFVASARHMIAVLATICVTFVSATAIAQITPTVSTSSAIDDSVTRILLEPRCGAGNDPKRVALIIGNGDYPELDWPKLANAANDLARLCESFAKVGFRVFAIEHADVATLRQAAEDFGMAAQSAETALVYYSGHGFEYAGNNYLVPVDAPPLASKSELETLFLPMSVLTQAANRASGEALFFLDACRSLDPVVQLSDIDPDGQNGNVGNLGLLELDRSVVFYATAKGSPAFDEAPEGATISPFARAVSERVATPGLELSYFFRAVGQDVVQLTEGMDPSRQYPFPYGQLYEDFFFVPPTPIAEPAIGIDGLTGNFPPQSISPAFNQYLDSLTLDYLGITDEPLIVGALLKDFTADDVRQAAEAGNAVAQYLFGYMLEFGAGVKKDVPGAKKWLDLAAAQNHPAAMLELGYWIIQYDRSPGYQDRAVDLFQRSADTGFAKGNSFMGTLYWDGNFVPQDKQLALKLLRDAADKGHPYAIYAAGFYGDEFDRADSELRELIAKGNDEGHAWLCELYFFKDRAGEAAQNCLIASKAGFAQARAIWSEMKFLGNGVAVDHAVARHWMKLAVAQNELPASRRARILSIASGFPERN